MPISTTCPSCKALFRLPEELAGRKVKCQKCQNLFVVPATDAGTVAPGAPLPGAEEGSKPAAESSPGKAKTAPTRPEDIPVTAQIDFDDDADPDDEEERLTRSKPRRGERRPGRDENPATRSKLLPIMLALLGLGLFSCVGAAGVLAVWLIAREEPQAPERFGQRPRPGGMVAKGGFKKPAGGDFKDLGLRRPNLTPAAEIKLGADGIFRQETELTLQDPMNTDYRRHKIFAIRLEAGKRYQIDLQSQRLDAYLVLLDDAGRLIDENDDIEDGINRDARIIFTPPMTGTYKIEATFLPVPDRGELGPLTLVVRELK